MTPISEFVVRALICDNHGNILLVKRVKNPDKDKWCLPGGKVNPGESSRQAIIREIKEELNLDFIPKTSFTRIDHQSVTEISCHVTYWQGITSGKITLKTDENSTSRYFSLAEIKQSSLIAFDHKKILLSSFI
jgi:8-oxo-dGTP diphosphatase